jgi:hypothetical protein
MLGLKALVLILFAAIPIPFRPFSPVNEVCPTCTTGPQYDKIQLVDGRELRAVVIAENEAFYVITKFGELRALAHDQVRSVTKSADAERPKGVDDQILLKDGIVLAGTIKQAAADHWEILVPPQTAPQIAPRGVTALVYQGGKLVFSAETAAGGK